MSDINITEVWKDIKGYEGLYQVSNMGRVKSLDRTFIDKIGHKHHLKGRILKIHTTNSGYLYVVLCGGSVQKTYKVHRLIHRLVCEAFLENPKNKPCVNHIDENKANNVASNLEWCTYKENNNHGTHNARMAKTLSKPVCQYTPTGELVKVWQSTTEVERRLGFSNSHISQVANGKRKTAYGYIWKYLEE